ncbi:MAG: hypothetical protein SPF59_06695 [Oscillospiraceae bacterium]|nr:hypothetical protein [Oscillospiraceae bacterium]
MKKGKGISKRKRKLLLKYLFRCVLAIIISAALITYAFVHYDQETKENTHTVTAHIDDFELLTSRHGGITVWFATDKGEYYYKVYYNSWPWNASREKQQELTEIFQDLIVNHEAVTVTVADEKDYSYVTTYGTGAEQAVEIRNSDGILFSIDGHNSDQKGRKIQMIIAACLVVVFCIAYQCLMKLLEW